MRSGIRSCFALAAIAAAGALASAQPQVPAGPLTYEQALALATSRNLNVEAARRARAIREAAIRTARQIPNPDVSFETTQDVPHQAFSVDLPVELGGKRSRRIDLAKEELTLAEVDIQTEMRAVRRELRQAFYGLIAADERVRLAESLLDIARRVHDAAQARFETGAERTPTPIFSAGALFNNPGEFTVASRYAVTVGVPIFSRNQGEIAGSIATTAQLRTKREATLRTVENQVYGVLARVEAARRQVEAYDQRLVPTATDLQTLAEESYRGGRTSVLGLLDAQRHPRDLRREALQGAPDLQLALADLEEVLGTPIQ